MSSDGDIQKLLNKVKGVEKGHQLDLSSGEDLSIGVMNLISVEEHLFFTAKKTGEGKFWNLLDEIRRMRVDLMKKLIPEYGGEVWCISKHLLAASMRMMEVGTKDLKKGDQKEAEEMFEKAYQLYNLFWSLNLGLVGREKGEGLEKRGDHDDGDEDEDDQENEKEITLIDEEGRKIKGTASAFSKLGDIVKKVIDCCRE